MRHVRLAPLVTVRTAFEASVVAARLGADGIGTQLRSTRSWAYPTNVGEVDIFVREDELVLAQELLLVDEVEAVFADLEFGFADGAQNGDDELNAQNPRRGTGAAPGRSGPQPRARSRRRGDRPAFGEFAFDERPSERPSSDEASSDEASSDEAAAKGAGRGARRKRWLRPTAALLMVFAGGLGWAAEQILRNR